MLLVGGLIFRMLLLPSHVQLSPDVWRYLWDARVTLHGYSPYVYAPVDKVLQPLRDILFQNSRYRNVVTVYPPGAQGIYILGYVLSPTTLIGIKGVFLVFDMITCGALSMLLARKGLDVRRVIIYAWCPLPIVEFALEGHVDVTAITFTVLAVLCATSDKRKARVLTGFFIGMGVLTKFYPLLLLAMFLRRQDWLVLATCFATILLGYLPFFVLGHGQVLGFIFSFVDQQAMNQGVVQLMVLSLGQHAGLKLSSIILLQHIVDIALVGAVALLVAIQCRKNRLSREGATLLLIGTFLSISTHVFPWYATALLPWIAVLVSPLRIDKKLHSKGIAVAAAWYFICVVALSYIPGRSELNTPHNWLLYYYIAYDVVVIGLGVAVIALGVNYSSSAALRQEL